MGLQVRFATSILSADFSRLDEELKKCESAGADMIHLDIMDGHFVSNITFGTFIVKTIREHTKLPLVAHLMIEQPDRYIKDFIQAGSDMITLHAECYDDSMPEANAPTAKKVEQINLTQIRQAISQIKSRERKVTVALNPGTPLCI